MIYERYVQMGDESGLAELIYIKIIKMDRVIYELAHKKYINVVVVI